MSEKFSLKWNDYNSNWNRSLSKLRENNAFADVTLITDDKVKFSAHRILLSSCSNVFDFILKDSNQANPLLYLGGMNSINLGFILDYIYKGEVNLYQEQLDSFLESANELEIEGLLVCDNQDIKVDLNIRQDDIEDISIGQFKETETVYQNEEKRPSNKHDSGYAKMKQKSSRVPKNDKVDINISEDDIEDVSKKFKETETVYQNEEKRGFELITNNSNSNTFDVSLLKYYITNN